MADVKTFIALGAQLDASRHRVSPLRRAVDASPVSACRLSGGEIHLSLAGPICETRSPDPCSLPVGVHHRQAALTCSIGHSPALPGGASPQSTAVRAPGQSSLAFAHCLSRRGCALLCSRVRNTGVSRGNVH
jgi:hypothetical protein